MRLDRIRRVRRWAVLALAGTVAVAAAAGIADRGLVWSVVTERTEARTLAADAAHRLAAAGEITLVDIRRPDEWRASGVPAGAAPLDMRRDDFTAALLELAGDPSAPVALICARGVRSAALSNRLIEAGFTNVADVAEGMFGSRAGPGWLARDLPVVRGDG